MTPITPMLVAVAVLALCRGRRLRHVHPIPVTRDRPTGCRPTPVRITRPICEKAEPVYCRATPQDAGVGASCWHRRPQIAFAVCWSDAAWSIRAAILPGSYRAREAAPDCGWSIAARPRPRSEWTRPAGDRGLPKTEFAPFSHHRRPRHRGR
jgi:hypothetical protein